MAMYLACAFLLFMGLIGWPLVGLVYLIEMALSKLFGEKK